MVFVIKHDGRHEEFDPEKIRQSCIRSGAAPEIVRQVVEYTQKKVYSGMSTKKLMKLVYAKLNRTGERHIAMRYGLKESIADMGPEGYEFEWYVTHLLARQGYKTTHSPEPKLQGRCVEHEIDVLAEKGAEKIIIECKHHFRSHTWTGLDVSLIQWARLQDLNDNGDRISGAWIVTNTKFSEHAVKYAGGKGIRLMGWNYPAGQGLERMIEAQRAYPLTLLKIPAVIRLSLVGQGLTNINEFLSAPEKILRSAGLPAGKIKELKELCTKLVNGSVVNQ